MLLNVLLIGAPESKGFFGGGGREAVYAWLLEKSLSVGSLFWPTANGFRRQLEKWQGPKSPFANLAELIQFCKDKSIDLVVIGPEQPLAEGLADQLRAAGIAVFGASEAAAQSEASKLLAKEMMYAAGVPTAAYRTFTNAAAARAYVRTIKGSCAVKADGLAEGKGAIVCHTSEEALAAIELCLVKKAFKTAGQIILIEEYLAPMPGVHSEMTCTVFVGPNGYVMAPFVQDNKAERNGGKGRNTGGMGVNTIDWVTLAMRHQVEMTIVQPILEQMRKDGMPFTGVLYIGLMWTLDGPYVVEINCRLGDPEAQVILLLWPDGTDFAEFLLNLVTGQKVDSQSILWKSGGCVCTVLASAGYPGEYEKDLPITGSVESTIGPENSVTVVFQAGTKYVPTQIGADDQLVTAGGRVLGVTTWSPLGTLHAAQLSLDRAQQFDWRDSQNRPPHLRTDIGFNVPSSLAA